MTFVKRFLMRFKAYRRQRAARFVRDFQQRFPGKCPVCSFHAYGVSHWHTTAAVVPHECAEHYARFQPKGY